MSVLEKDKKAALRREASVEVGEQTREGIMWTALFDGLQFVIRFVGSIILARILFPEDFGLMGLALIVIQLARRLANFGFNMVLVQLKTVKKEHYETVFMINLVLLGGLTAALWFAGGYIAEFFNNERIAPIISVLAVDFLLRAFISVPNAILRRTMLFKKLEQARAVGAFFAILTPVVLALTGFGVWSLVFGYLCGSLAEMVMTMCYARWLPKFKFHFWAFKEVFAFGLWVYIDGYISYGIKKVDFFCVGKFLGAAQLGFYERAFNLMSLPRQRIAVKINNVLFSAYSRIQDQPERIVKAMLRVVTYFSIITLPLMTWMYFVAPSLITVLYGQKWKAVIKPLQIMCLAGVFDTFSLILGPVLLAAGLVGHRTRRKFIHFIILGIFVIVGLQWQIIGVAWATTAASLVQFVLMLQLCVKHLPFTVLQFLKAQKSAFSYSLIQATSLSALILCFRNYISMDSATALLLLSAFSTLVLIVTHKVLKSADIDESINEIYFGIKKFAVRVPIVRWFYV